MTKQETTRRLGNLGACAEIRPLPEAMPPGLLAAALDIFNLGIVHPLNDRLRRGEPCVLDSDVVQFDIERSSSHCGHATIALGESVEMILRLEGYAAHVPGPTGFELNAIRLEHVREATWRLKHAEAAQ